MARGTVLDVAGEPLNAAGLTMKEAERAAAEKARVRRVQWSRVMYNGTQFDGLNIDRAKALGVDVELLPEHEKLHAYSTQIQEAVDYLAGQMSDGFDLSVDDNAIQEILMKALKRSPDLAGGYAENDLSLTNMVRDALIAQDTPVLIRWDGVAGTAWPEFWDSELVEFVLDDRDRYKTERVVTRQAVWDTDINGDPLKKIEVSEWYLNAFECIKEVYFEGERDRGRAEPLGIPFIPWVSLRCTMKQTRGHRGESIITTQAIGHAARYNALEQISYLIARYNSHGNLAVIGDGASLKAQMDERINKDVADILTFPGGTALSVLQLPTDPQMIQHQRTVLLDSLYGSFGLARVDQETLTGLGQVTGYALDILNRKSEQTFNQIRNQYVGDFKRMLNMILDMTAYKAAEQNLIEAAYTDPLIVPDQVALGEQVLLQMDSIDPLSVYPETKRVFKVHLGTGQVVDRVMIRDDFTAGLISRKEALRQEGYTEPEINKIMGEIKDETPPPPPTGLGAGALGAGAAALAAGAAAAQKGVAGKPAQKQIGAPSDVGGTKAAGS